jgi:phosphate transport system substrate-binding protein
MKRSLAGILAAVALVSTVGLTGPAASAKATLTASGSSFALGIMTACKTHFSGADLTYTGPGSGAGRTSFSSKSIDFAMSDGLYAAGTQPANFNYVPLVGGPVAIAFNVPTVKKLNLNADLISRMYLGTITKWNDAAIAKINKGVKLPSLAIQPIYRATSSGTAENFTNYLSKVAGQGWVKSSTFSAGNKVVGTGAANSAAVVTTIAATVGGFGYSDLSDVATSGLAYASIFNGANQYIKPDVRSAKAFLAVQTVASNGIVTYDYRTPVKGAYPISLISYALAYKNGNKLVQGFLQDFVNSCAPTEAAKLNYVAIDGKLKKTALDLIDQIG